MLCQLAPGCGLHRRTPFPHVPLCTSRPILRQRPVRRLTVAAHEEPSKPAPFHSQAMALGLALALSVFQPASVKAADLSSGSGLLESYQRAKGTAGKTVSEAAKKVVEPVKGAIVSAPRPSAVSGTFAKPTIAPKPKPAPRPPPSFPSLPKSSGPSVGDSLKSAFTTSPPQISRKPAPIPSADAGGFDPVLIAAGALAVGAAGLGTLSARSRSAGQGGTAYLAERFQASAARAPKPRSISLPLPKPKPISVPKPRPISLPSPRQVASAAAGGTRKVTSAPSFSPQRKGGTKLFQAPKPKPAAKPNFNFQAPKPAATALRPGQAGSAPPVSPVLISVGTLGLVLASSLLFATLPKPASYNSSSASKKVDYSSVPAPLPAKQDAGKFEKPKEFALVTEAPATKAPEAKKAAPPAPPKPQVPSFSTPTPPKPQVPQALKAQAPKAQAPKAQAPQAAKPPSIVPSPSAIQKPSTPSGPELKPQETKKPESGLPLAAPASKPQTPSAPELVQKVVPTPAPKPAAAPKPAPAPAAPKAAAPFSDLPNEVSKVTEWKVVNPFSNVKPPNFGGGPQKQGPQFELPSNVNIPSNQMGGYVAAAAAVVVGAAISASAAQREDGGGPARASASASSSASSAGGGGGSESSGGDSRPAAGPAGESTPEDIKQRKQEVQEWVKDWRARTR